MREEKIKKLTKMLKEKFANIEGNKNNAPHDAKVIKACLEELKDK